MPAESPSGGLEGVVAGETRLSRVDGEAGDLTIGGFPVAELAPNARFEETLFLLFEDRLPTPDELDAFEGRLAERRALPAATVDALRAGVDADQSPMDALRIGAATAGMARGGTEDPETDALLLVAQFPAIVAAYWRLRNDEAPVEPRPDLGHAADFLYLLTGEVPDDVAARSLETYLNAVVDHGLNASTFAARTIVSTESDLISAVTGAVGALKGPLHGGAPGPVLDTLLEVEAAGDPEGVLRGKLEAGDRLMGFGHRVYRVRDPRVAVLSAAAEHLFRGDDRSFFELAHAVEDAGVALLAEHKPERALRTNVEFYTAVLLHGLGIPRELFTTTFGVARVGGWTAHCLEQLADNRLIRPTARYVGAAGRTWTPLADR